MRPGTPARLLAPLLVTLALPAAAWAQTPPDAGDPAPSASPAASPPPAPSASPASSRCLPAALTSPQTDWLRAAIRRVELAGSYELASAGTGTLPLGTAVLALESAARDGETAAVRRAAASYLERLAIEHPHLARDAARDAAGEAGSEAAGEAAGDEAAGCGRWLDARMAAGYGSERGLHRPGYGYELEAWTGAFAVDAMSSLAGGVTAVAGAGRLGGRLEVMGHDNGLDLRDAHLAADLGDVVVWAGRRAIHYGPAHGGGLVIGGDALVTGVGAVVTDPLHLPWILGALGPIGMESFFSKARGGERIVDPWFWGARLTASPHPRFRIGASRGTMYGGEGNTPVTLYHSLEMLMGMHSGIAGEFDNHFGSVDLRYRPPGVPLDLYLIWAMNDSAGAWWAIPARMLGINWSALPFAPGVGVAAEAVHFPRSCCGNPKWYRNWAFRMGWTTDGEPVAHPLGGHGHEVSIRIDGVTIGGAAVGHARAFQRYRGIENIFAPQWRGRSLGAEAALQIQPGPGAGVMLRGFIEAGDDWRAGRVFTGLTWSFGG